MLRDETFPVNYLISQLNLSQHRFNDTEQQAGNNKSNQNIKSLCSKKRPHDIAVFTGDNIFYLGFQSYTDKCQTEKNSTEHFSDSRFDEFPFFIYQEKVICLKNTEYE